MRRDITFLALGGGSLLLSFCPGGLPVNPAWLAILLCGAPIVREAPWGCSPATDIKADVLVSLALLASVAIGEIFAAGEIAFIARRLSAGGADVAGARRVSKRYLADA